MKACDCEVSTSIVKLKQDTWTQKADGMQIMSVV